MLLSSSSSSFTPPPSLSPLTLPMLLAFIVVVTCLFFCRPPHFAFPSFSRRDDGTALFFFVFLPL